VGSGAGNLSRRQFLPTQVKSRGVKPVGVDPVDHGFQVWKRITQDDVTFFGFNQL
jgi:hypothetical protein